MKKYLWVFLITGIVNAGGLSYWGLDKLTTFSYTGYDTLSTPYFQGKELSILTIEIFQVVPPVSWANYERISSIFPILFTQTSFEEDTLSTAIIGPFVPLYGATNSLILGIIIPDTMYIYDTTYTWTPGVIGDTFITDVDRDTIDDTIVIDSARGKPMGLDTIDVPIGTCYAFHFQIKLWGSGKFGNQLPLEHYLEINRWWTPFEWYNSGLSAGFGLIKEEFYQVDSAPGPGYHILANNSSGRGSSLLESVNIEEKYRLSEKDEEIKTLLTFEKTFLPREIGIFEISGRKRGNLSKGIFFGIDKRGKVKFRIIKLR